MPCIFSFRFIANLSISLGAVFAIIAVIFYLGFDISTKSTFISDTQSKLLTRVLKLDNLAKLKEQERIADAALLKLNNALPKREVLFSVNRDLEGLAALRELGFSSKFGEEIAATEKSPGLIRLDISVQGSYDGIVNFMRDIESSSYFINILNFDIVRQGSRFNAFIGSDVFFND